MIIHLNVLLNTTKCHLPTKFIKRWAYSCDIERLQDSKIKYDDTRALNILKILLCLLISLINSNTDRLPMDEYSWHGMVLAVINTHIYPYLAIIIIGFMSLSTEKLNIGSRFYFIDGFIYSLTLKIKTFFYVYNLNSKSLIFYKV